MQLTEENPKKEETLRAPAKRYQLQELAEWRTQDTQKRICRQSLANGMFCLSRAQHTVEKHLNANIHIFKQRQYQLLRRRQELQNKNRTRTTSDPCQTDRSSNNLSSSPLAAELQAGGSTLRREFQRQRSVTVSLPVDHSRHNTDMKMLDGQRRSPGLKTPLRVNLNTSKLMDSTSTTLQPMSGMKARHGEVIIATRDDTHIPKSVLQRGRRMSRSVTNMSELVRQEISDYVDKKAKEPLPDLMSPNSTIPALSPAYRTTQMSTATNSPRLQRATSPDTEPVSPRDRISSITSTDSEDNCNMSPRVTSEGMPLPSPPLQPRPPSQAKRNARHLRRAQVKPQDCIN